MTSLREWLARLKGTVRPDRSDADMQEELRAHLELATEDERRRGTSDHARRAAVARVGGTGEAVNAMHDQRSFRWVEELTQDLRYGVRTLRRSPVFTAVVVLSLSLGTGANAAIFQLVNAVRLQSLPVERPGELVSIGVDRHGKGRVGRGVRGRSIHTEPLWQALRAEQQAFTSVFAWGTSSWDLATSGEYRPARGFYVSGNYFDALGVKPHAGRLLNDADDQKGCGSPVAVLSHGFWQARYGGDPGVVGRPIMLDRRPFEVVGVAPAGFFGVEVGRTFDVAIPMCAEPLIRAGDAGTGVPSFWWLDVMGRLKPGWTAERAGAHLAAISPGIFNATVSPRYNAEQAGTYKSFNFTAVPAQTGVSNLRTDYAMHLWVLLGATGLVLLITCANLANLMLARATAREREIAVRLAIGASRWRIVRQMVSESLLIAALGAIGGGLLARWLSEGLVTFLSTDSNRIFMDLSPDWRVFAFLAGLAATACLLFGLSPALKATGTNPGKGMQAGGRSSTEGRQAFAVRRGLVVLQVALSLVLVVGAVLFGRSLRNLSAVDYGFRLEGILATNIDLRRTAVTEEGRQQAFAAIMARIRAVPGVIRASEIFIVPMSNSDWNGRIVVDGALQDTPAHFNQVGGEYFATTETALIAGRTFDTRDRIGSTVVAVVNETFARKYFNGENPVGKRFSLEPSPGETLPAYEIIGLARDTKYLDLRERPRPIAYIATTQEARLPPWFDLIVRTDLPQASITPSLTRAILEVTPGAAVDYTTITSYVQDAIVTERLMATLSAFFGALAMLIATIGLYGVMSYMVTRRKVEIGVRMALGADPASVVRMVLGESGTLLAAGVAAGLVLAFLVSRYADALLFGVKSWDPVSFALAAAALAAVSLVAAWIPARRASRLAPTIALRES